MVQDAAVSTPASNQQALTDEPKTEVQHKALRSSTEAAGVRWWKDYFLQHELSIGSQAALLHFK